MPTRMVLPTSAATPKETPRTWRRRPRRGAGWLMAGAEEGSEDRSALAGGGRHQHGLVRVPEHLTLERHAVPAAIQRVRVDGVAWREHGLQIGAPASGLAHVGPRLRHQELARASSRRARPASGSGTFAASEWTNPTSDGASLESADCRSGLGLARACPAHVGHRQYRTQGEQPGRDAGRPEPHPPQSAHRGHRRLFNRRRELPVAPGASGGDAQGPGPALGALLVGLAHQKCDDSCCASGATTPSGPEPAGGKCPDF